MRDTRRSKGDIVEAIVASLHESDDYVVQRKVFLPLQSNPAFTRERRFGNVDLSISTGSSCDRMQELRQTYQPGHNKRTRWKTSGGGNSSRKRRDCRD